GTGASRCDDVRPGGDHDQQKRTPALGQDASPFERAIEKVVRQALLHGAEWFADFRCAHAVRGHDGSRLSEDERPIRERARVRTTRPVRRAVVRRALVATGAGGFEPPISGLTVRRFASSATPHETAIPADSAWTRPHRNLAAMS